MLNFKPLFQVDVTNETTTLHINDPNDYLGRNYLHPPQDEAVNLNKVARPARCFLPKKLIHTYKGHSKVIFVYSNNGPKVFFRESLLSSYFQQVVIWFYLLLWMVKSRFGRLTESVECSEHILVIIRCVFIINDIIDMK